MCRLLVAPGAQQNLHSMKSNLRKNSKPVSPLRNGPKPVSWSFSRLTSSGLRAWRLYAQSCTNATLRWSPVPGLTLTNYYLLGKIGFVPRKSRNRSRCTSSSFFRVAPESTFRPLPLPPFPIPSTRAIPSLGDSASQPMPFFALRAQICTNPTTLHLCIREPLDQLSVERRRPPFVSLSGRSTTP